MKHVHWITAEPYAWPILIYIGSWAQYRAYVRRTRGVDLGDMHANGGSHSGLYNPRNGDNMSAVWLPETPLGTMNGVRSLSHELLHAALCILNHVGVAADYDHQEALCYLHESLNRMAHRALNGNRVHGHTHRSPDHQLRP